MAVGAIGQPDVVAVEDGAELAPGTSAWKNSDSVGFDGAVLTVAFANEPGWPSARAVVYVGPFELPRSW